MKRQFFLYLSLIAAAASAAGVSSDRLYDTTNIRHISFSHSAELVAGIASEEGSRSKFVLFERKNGKLNPIWKINSSESQHIVSYEWLPSGDVLLNYDVRIPAEPMTTRLCEHILTCNEVGTPTADRFSKAFSILRIAEHRATIPQMYDSLVKEAWGDSDHVLVSVKTEDGTCLMVRNLRSSHGDVCISKPLKNWIMQHYFAVSETEVYVLGLDEQGARVESQLDLPSGKWFAVPADALREKFKQMTNSHEPSAEILSKVNKLGLGEGKYVRTPTDGRIVGYCGPAPHPSFTSFDPGLDRLQILLEERYPGYRLKVSQVTDDLQHAFIEVWKDGVPVRGIFYDAPSSFTEYAEISPKVNDSDLGPVHYERGWVSGPVAVTMPPAGVPLIGAIVVPFTSEAEREEEPIHFYYANYQIFAKSGIAVAQILLPIADLNGAMAAGAKWRERAIVDVSIVIDHVHNDLLHGGPICLYGYNEDASLALEFGKLSGVGCVIAEAPLLDDGTLPNNKRLVKDFMLNSWPKFTRKSAIPAIFGDDKQDAPLIDSASWVLGLPKHIMLAFNRNDKTDDFYADYAATFRDALREPGRQVNFYAPQPVGWAAEPKYAVDLSDNMAKFAASYFNSANASSR